MSRPIIVQGDTTDHGGIVVEGHPQSRIDGKPIATIGMKVSCPIHGETTITTGSAWAEIDGRKIARDGDKTSCDATLICSQTLARID